MVFRGFGRALAAAAALLALGGPARAIDPLPAEAKAVPDPAVRTGTFANGLRYAIMRNGSPAKAVSIRLAVRAGSYDEKEAEGGFAHFVEHMAFRSTRQAPEGSLDTRFASLGVAFGRDENAATGLESTIYQMDVPVADPAAVAKVLEWLRGAADGILFAPAAVELEKGVVVAELRARTSPATIAGREAARFQAPELRSITRETGGTEASVRAATPAALQAFYDRWYRPDNAVLVIVGDGDSDALLKAAETAFGSWTGRGAPGSRATPAALPQRGLDSFSRSGPSLPLAESACRVAPLDGPRDFSLERMRRETLSQIWVTILSDRATQAATRAGSALLGAAPLVNRSLPDARIACLIAVPNQGKWREGLAEAQAELRRFAETGPTPSKSRPPPSSCAPGFAAPSIRAAPAPPATSPRRSSTPSSAGAPYLSSRGGDAGLRPAGRGPYAAGRQARLRGGLERQRAPAGPDRARRGEPPPSWPRRGGRTRRRRRSRPSRTARPPNGPIGSSASAARSSRASPAPNIRASPSGTESSSTSSRPISSRAESRSGSGSAMASAASAPPNGCRRRWRRACSRTAASARWISSRSEAR